MCATLPNQIKMGSNTILSQIIIYHANLFSTCSIQQNIRNWLTIYHLTSHHIYDSYYHLSTYSRISNFILYWTQYSFKFPNITLYTCPARRQHGNNYQLNSLISLICYFTFIRLYSIPQLYFINKFSNSHPKRVYPFYWSNLLLNTRFTY